MFALTPDAIDVAAVERAVLHPSCGAVLLFLGTARDNFGERTVTHLAYEAYEEVAVAELQAIGRECAERWPGCRTAIVHRLGTVPVTEPTVVMVPERHDGSACRRADGAAR